MWKRKLTANNQTRRESWFHLIEQQYQITWCRYFLLFSSLPLLVVAAEHAALLSNDLLNICSHQVDRVCLVRCAWRTFRATANARNFRMQFPSLVRRLPRSAAICAATTLEKMKTLLFIHEMKMNNVHFHTDINRRIDQVNTSFHCAISENLFAPFNSSITDVDGICSAALSILQWLHVGYFVVVYFFHSMSLADYSFKGVNSDMNACFTYRFTAFPLSLRW